jgi:translation initiation factor IF-2
MVQNDSGKHITFLDTPGHEAFTAMRARGAQLTDIAIIVAAADDDIMPQTKEAISHAQAAGVPIVFAINKIDKVGANPEKIKEGLAQMNLLVEDWGGKIQSHDISAKIGTGVKELLEKVLLEAELLDLKANPNKPATGTVVEAFLDKGRGYVSTVLVQSGTLRVGDYLLAGPRHGKIKAMQDERGKEVLEAGPATPVSVLGLGGAPQAGDKFNVFEDEREAKSIAARRTQLQREQSVRTQKTLSLDEIGRRIALGDFKELNLILKGDVDGSVEALTDSFQKLSTEEIQVNIIHKGVGAITETDVLLATASNAIIIGFNVRPQGNARSVADREEVDIRTYSIIYDAINDLKDAMEGMLSPELKEEITGNAEVRQTFKISKIGTIAGCMVTDGKIFRNGGVRLIRDGVVIHTGELVALKRFKDDVKEVAKGYECGMQIKNYNDLQEGDIMESFREVEVKKTLK